MEGHVVARFLLSNEQWELSEDVFPPAAPTGRPRRDPRQVFERHFFGFFVREPRGVMCPRSSARGRHAGECSIDGPRMAP